MKNRFAIVLILLSLFGLSAQNNCIYIESQQDSSTRLLYDYATTIEVVTYKADFSEEEGNEYSKNRIKDGKFIINDISERILLNRQQIDSLYSIFFNVVPDTSIKNNKILGSECYIPHHAIVFYKKGKAIAFFEICFLCSNYKHSEEYRFGKLCEGKICMFSNFFRFIGIKEFLKKNCH